MKGKKIATIIVIIILLIPVKVKDVSMDQCIGPKGEDCTIHYWPLALALLGMILIRSTKDGEKFPKYKIIGW